jgi:hypothetical protein
MSREASFLKILESSASIQKNIAIILEAQADEAEKSRNWLCMHIQPYLYSDHDRQLKQSLGVHEQLVALIEGLTKVEFGLAKNLKVLLETGDDSTFDFDGLADLFGAGPGEGKDSGKEK